MKESGTSFIFVTFILSLLDLLRLCYPFIPLFVTVCFSDLSFCYINFNFNLLYLSRLVTKGKRRKYRQLFSLLILSRKTVRVEKKLLLKTRYLLISFFSFVLPHGSCFIVVVIFFSFYLSNCGFNK